MQATQNMKEILQQKWAKRPLIISGPCSAETEEQVIETIQRLGTGLHYRFHLEGSRSIVGSFGRNIEGEPIKQPSTS